MKRLMNLLSEEHLAQAISEEVRSVGTDGLTRVDTSALNTSCPFQRSAATLSSRPTGTGHVLHTTHLQGWIELPGLASTSPCRRHGDRLRHPFPGPRVRFASSPTYQLGGRAESAPPEPSLHHQVHPLISSPSAFSIHHLCAYSTEYHTGDHAETHFWNKVNEPAPLHFYILGKNFHCVNIFVHDNVHQVVNTLFTQ